MDTGRYSPCPQIKPGCAVTGRQGAERTLAEESPHSLN